MKNIIKYNFESFYNTQGSNPKVQHISKLTLLQTSSTYLCNTFHDTCEIYSISLQARLCQGVELHVTDYQVQ